MRGVMKTHYATTVCALRPGPLPSEKATIGARAHAQRALEGARHARWVVEAGTSRNDLGFEPGGRDQQAGVLGAQALDHFGRRGTELSQAPAMQGSQ